MINLTLPIEMIDKEFLKIDSEYTTTTQEYVEVIRDLVDENRVARVKDIARRRGITRSSVSIALKSLHNLELINHEHYGFVTLTQKGIELSEILSQRHLVIQRFLRDCLKIEPQLAESEACRLEHTMSWQTMTALVRFVREAEKCSVCARITNAD